VRSGRPVWGPFANGPYWAAGQPRDGRGRWAERPCPDFAVTPVLTFALAAVLVLAGASLLAMALRTARTSGRVPRLDALLATALMLVGAGLVWQAAQPPPLPVPSAEGRARRAPPGGPVPSSTPDVPAPELRYTLLGGQTEALADLRGKVVLVNFWATWCGPCRSELPALSDLQDKLGPLGLVVLTITEEPVDTVRAFLRELPLRTTVARVSGPGALTGPFAGGLDYLPTSFVVDREGVVVAREVGARSREEFEALVAGPLAPNLAAR